MRSCIGVCAHHHLESGRPQRHRKHGCAEGMRLFHRRETFFGVITETEKALLVFEIVWKVESDVGIEPDALLSEHSEGFPGREHAMLDSRATCTRCADHRFGTLRMDHRAEALRASFAAGRIELFLRKSRRTAFPNAEGRKDLDEIGPFRFLLSNILAKLLRRQPRVGHLVERSEDPWARQHAARNGIAKRLVGRRAYTLYRSESRHECDVRVFCAVERRLVRSFSTVDPPVIRIEVPSDMNVGVDEPRQKRHRAEVITHFAGRRPNTFDLRPTHRDDYVPLYAAAAINDLRRADRYRCGGLLRRQRY